MPAAQRQLDAADERWVDEHGPLADNPLLEQIEHATVQLRASPELGKIVRRGRATIYRFLLPARWHLYYRYLADRELVEIVAIWYGGRGEEPPL